MYIYIYMNYFTLKKEIRLSIYIYELKVNIYNRLKSHPQIQPQRLSFFHTLTRIFV